MLEDIKKELLSNPDKLKDVLEHYNYCNIVIRNTYMSFGRNEHSSKKSIVIRLENNCYLYVNDYARNINKDLFSYIIEQRKVTFSDVLNTVKIVLGITDYYDFFDSKRYVFGGFYEKIRKKNTSKVRVYDESVLKCYKRCGNKRFMKDHISLASQKHFNIRYDVESQSIVIPIYDQVGQLMGAKARCNWEVEDGELKYFYLIPCLMSQTLYAYSQNYNYLVNNTIYVFEAEKSPLQCYSYGIRNCVALGSGSISQKQVQMLLELNPKKIIFMHDTGYKMESVMRNIEMVKNYSRFSEIEVGYWDWTKGNYQDKVSPSDMGESTLKYILEHEIEIIGDSNEDEL
jgi:hypothetical protein